MFSFYLCFKKESHFDIVSDMSVGGDRSWCYNYPLFLSAHAIHLHCTSKLPHYLLCILRDED